MTDDERITEQHYGSDVWRLRLDHQLRDQVGRCIGGCADIEPEGALFSVRIHATRDGVKFGALRRRSLHIDLAAAKATARKKLVAQGKAFRRRYGSRES